MPSPTALGTQTNDLDERQQLSQQDFTPCMNPSCGWMHAPGQAAQDCPSCGATEADANDFFPEGTLFAKPGGSTRAGISLTAQGRLGEDIVHGLGELPGYGPITWWSDHYNSPLDGAVGDWGVEVKASNVDNVTQQFVIRPEDRITKNAQAAQMGFKGILGVLVILDYRRSLADIYCREFTLAPWKGNNGRTYQGVGFYRKHSDYKLVEEVPFKNPFLDPSHPAPDLPF
jgi:hypothetical protein